MAYIVCVLDMATGTKRVIRTLPQTDAGLALAAAHVVETARTAHCWGWSAPWIEWN